MNKFIDHTCLRPNATQDNIEKLCEEAEKYKFRTVCVAPSWLHITKAYAVNTCTVIGFPTGAHTPDVKIKEALEAIDWGVYELDVVWNIGRFKSKKYLAVLAELSQLVCVVAPFHVKVIVEEHYLNAAERDTAWKIVRDSGAWCIKTSTGTALGASISTVGRWKALGDDLKIKAAGGIRTLATAQAFRDAGADIIGTSHGVGMMETILNPIKTESVLRKEYSNRHVVYNPKKYYDNDRVLNWSEDIPSEKMEALRKGEVFTLLNLDGKPHVSIMMDSYDVIREKKL